MSLSLISALRQQSTSLFHQRRHFVTKGTLNMKLMKNVMNGNYIVKTMYVEIGDSKYPVGSLKSSTPAWSTCIAVRNLAVNEVIGTARGFMHPVPTRYTIQMALDKHVEIDGGMQFANHSCDPNASFRMSETEPVVTLVAIKPIAQGEDITFDYNTTEWNMHERFKCSCGTSQCRGHIQGAKHMHDADILKLLPHFSTSNLRSLLKAKLVQG